MSNMLFLGREYRQMVQWQLRHYSMYTVSQKNVVSNFCNYFKC